MLTGLEPTNRVLGMHPVGQHDVNDVNFRIVPDRVVVLIVVNIFRAHAVTERQFAGFVGVAADQGHHLRLLAFRKRRQDLVDGQTAQSDNRPSRFLSWRIRHLQRVSAFQERPGKIGYRQTLSNFGDEPPASNFFGE